MTDLFEITRLRGSSNGAPIRSHVLWLCANAGDWEVGGKIKKARLEEEAL